MQDTKSKMQGALTPWILNHGSWNAKTYEIIPLEKSVTTAWIAAPAMTPPRKVRFVVTPCSAIKIQIENGIQSSKPEINPGE